MNIPMVKELPDHTGREKYLMHSVVMEFMESDGIIPSFWMLWNRHCVSGCPTWVQMDTHLLSGLLAES